MLNRPSKEKWSNFEQKIWKNLKNCNLDSHENFLLCVSGGLDSMTLLNVFLRIRPNVKIKVIHYHHGDSDDLVTQKFRDESENLIRHSIENLSNSNVSFHSSKSLNTLNSEAEMRLARWDYINSLKTSSDVVVTAHHLDDRFETILLNLIRGSASDGVINFKMWNTCIFRPLMDFTKQELLLFAEANSLHWIEDPSNAKDSYLRNWIREKWLKELDQKVPMGSKNFAKSLLKISDQLSMDSTFDLVLIENSSVIAMSRTWYVSLSRADQIRALAIYLKKHHIYEFTSGQLEEIRKRLDKNQKDITFELLRRKWVINASQIVLE